jgi:RND superfamily putative drug exporter
MPPYRQDVLTTGTDTAPLVVRDQRVLGALGRLGVWSSEHGRSVMLAWGAAVLILGVFAPQVMSALSGAGWQDNGSDSVAVRELAEQHFGGNASSALQVVVTADASVTGQSAQRVLEQAESLLSEDVRVASVVPPVPGVTISADESTAILLAGAAADPDEMVRVADDLKEPLAELATDDVQVYVTGASVLWSDFNEANHDAMIRSEMLSWPVTLAILVLAFGSLVAAGLPLLLTLAGLVSAAGSLVLLTELTSISIWAMNFAMMFALALGIDYALFMVARFRGALFGHDRPVHEAIGETMDTAGKAVLLSGVTVLISLSAVMIVPSPAFRSMAAGIMLAVAFVLAATLTLLPAVLGKLGRRVDALALPWVHAGEHRSPRFAAWGERLWRTPVRYGVAATLVLLALAAPIIGLKTAMPSITVLPEDASARQGYDVVQSAFGEGAPGMLQVVSPAADSSSTVDALAADPGIAGVMPPQPAADAADLVLVQAVPTVDPSDPALGETVDRLRSELPDDVLVGGAAVENLDLQSALDQRLPWVVGIVLTLGFLLLLVALQAPLMAALGTLTSLLSTAAAFGVARLIFQDGIGADLFRFEPQGFLDGWAPVFFFAMIFAIAMDYTVFLLASAKEHFENSGDPREAMVGAVAHSGRVIFAAAGVMVAVFFTFALSGPLPPKEMGVVLGVAVLLDALLVRLVLLPVLLRLTGRAAWASPRWLRRVLPNITFSHG